MSETFTFNNENKITFLVAGYFKSILPNDLHYYIISYLYIKWIFDSKNLHKYLELSKDLSKVIYSKGYGNTEGASILCSPIIKNGYSFICL